ncbi:hypothetical protein IAU60_004176 [Kwoniella sp. DSM 27419]
MTDPRLAFLRLSYDKTPVSCSFEHQAEGIKGEVELNYWPARVENNVAPEHLVVFILGNPGLLGYYPPFLDHLHSLLPDTHAILATSHIGHSVTVPSPPSALDVPQQLESKVELVTTLRTYLDEWAAEGSGPRPKLSLMGHSVGAWFLCETMKRLNTPGGERPVEAGYMLFPTLGWIANSWNGWTLWPIFHRPVKPLLPLLAPLLRPILPFTSLPPTSLSLVRNPKVIEHVLHLSKSEMEVIRDLDTDWYRSQRISTRPASSIGDGSSRKGLYGIWAAGNLDGWVGKDGPIVQEALGGADGGRVKLLQGVPHAFCLTQEHSELVAEVVAAWLNHSSPKEPETPKEPPSEPAGASVIPM